MDELNIVGAASGSSALVAVAVVIIKDWVKSRNGGSSATRQDIKDLSTKLSSDIGGVYNEIKTLTERCHDRHAVLERELGENDKRLEYCEKEIGKSQEI